MLGNKASGMGKVMGGIDSAFATMDSLTQTDAERRLKEQKQAAQSEAGTPKLKDFLKVPDALKVSLNSHIVLSYSHAHAQRETPDVSVCE